MQGIRADRVLKRRHSGAFRNIRNLWLFLSSRRHHQKPQCRLLAIERISVQLSVYRKDCLNPIHPVPFEQVKFLLVFTLLVRSFKISRRSPLILSEGSSRPETDLSRQLMSRRVDRGNENGDHDLIRRICIVSQLQRTSAALIQAAKKHETICEGENGKEQ